jgi:hypothetical protein
MSLQIVAMKTACAGKLDPMAQLKVAAAKRERTTVLFMAHPLTNLARSD